MRKTKTQYKSLSTPIDSFKTKRDIRGRTDIMTSGVKPLSKNLFGTNFRLRTRKNFSLILLAGLTALLCALYYTSYYPGTVWTLRFGVTSFTPRNNGTNSQQQPELTPTTAANSIQNSLSGQNGGSAGVGLNRKTLPSAHDESRSARNHQNSSIANSLAISKRKDGGNNHHNKKEGGESGETSGEISTPKEWDWKYWASLSYWKDWKVNVSNDEDGYESNQPVGKVEGEQGIKNSAQLLQSSATVTLASGKSMPNAVVPLGATRTAKKRKKEGLACKFPRLTPFDPSITEFIRNPPDIDCAKEHHPVFRTNFRNKLIQLGHPFRPNTENPDKGERRERLGNYTCCYKTVSRGNGSDRNITYSKRCFPILKAETEIPTTHEFISVRCRSIGNRTKSQRKGPPERSKDTTNGPTSNSTSPNNNIGNNSSSSNNTTKVYRDMMAFVPLKPWVEDRIRKYEESKRKSLYVQKRTNSNNKSSLGKNEGKGRINTQQKQYKDLRTNPLEVNGFHHHQVSHIVKEEANEKDLETSQLEMDEEVQPTTSANEDRLSVVILGLDAQSHLNFIRQMPLTYNFLTKNLSSIGMYGYTKVGDNTFPNVVASLAGLTEDELERVCWHKRKSYFDSCPFIWRKFAESGYRTSLAEDAVWMGSFNYGKKGFFQSPTDYYLHPMTLLMSGKIGHEGRGNANLCYGPRLAFDVLLDYIVKTAVTFRNSLYFQFVWSNSLFHDYLNNPRLGDEILAMTLQFLRNNGFLNNTAFILLSDHGIRWGEILSTYQGKIEERMPFIYFTFPHWFRHKYPHAMRNLRRNAMRLTTPFDVHETLKDILQISQGKHIRFDRWNDSESNNDSKRSYTKGSYGVGSDGESDEKPPRGISLFRPVPLKRTCKLAGIDEQWCVCHSMQSININSTLVQSAAQFIVHVINGLVRKHGGLCAKLSLFKINEAKRIIDGDIDKGLDVDFSVGKGESGKNVSVPSNISSSWHTSAGRSSKDSNMLSDVNRTESKNDIVIGVGTNLSIHKYHKTENATGDETGDKKDGEQTSGQNAVINASTVAGTREGDTVMSSLSTSSDIKRMIQLQITLITRPGDAMFEATIYGEAVIGNDLVSDQDINQEAGERSHHHWKLAGDMSRLNMYGKQSSCITDLATMKYCYCIKQGIN